MGQRFLFLTSILAILIVLSTAGYPVKGAKVDIEGMKWDYVNGENVTDSGGKFIVEIEPGEHRVIVMKDNKHSITLEYFEKGKKVYVILEGVE